MQTSARNMIDLDHKRVALTTEMENDFDLMISLIHKRDKTSLKELLNNKSVNILNINKDGWFALHEAVDLGYTDIVKLIVKFATQHGIKVLEMWDLTTASRQKYSCVAFNELIFLEDNDSIIPTTQQTSFLRLAVQSQQLKLINFFIKLYKKLSNLSIVGYELRRREISESGFLNACVTRINGIQPKHAGVLEAMFKSVTHPEILRNSLYAFPEFLHYYKGKLVAVAMKTAINQNKLENVSRIFSLMFDLLRSKETTFIECKINIFSCILNMATYCAELSYTNKDITVLQLFIETAAGKSLLTDSHSCTNKLLKEKSCETFQEAFGRITRSQTTSYKNCVLYCLLYYFCHRGSVNMVRFLVEIGLDVGFSVFSNSREISYESLQIEYKWCREFYQLSRSVRYFSPFKEMFVTKAKCDELCNRSCVLALFWAALSSNIDVLKYLLTIMEKKEFYKSNCPCHSSLYIDVTNVMHFESLHLLLKAGFHIETFCPPKQGMQCFLDVSVLADKKARVHTIKTLVNYGAIEFMFGHHNSTTPFMQYLKHIWSEITFYLKHNELSRIWKDEMLILEEKFDVLLKHLGLFTFTSDHGYYIEQAVPTMKQLCRYVIRCCIIKKCKTLHYVHELPIPASLKSYLCCN